MKSGRERAQEPKANGDRSVVDGRRRGERMAAGKGWGEVQATGKRNFLASALENPFFKAINAQLFHFLSAVFFLPLTPRCSVIAGRKPFSPHHLFFAFDGKVVQNVVVCGVKGASRLMPTRQHK